MSATHGGITDGGEKGTLRARNGAPVGTGPGQEGIVEWSHERRIGRSGCAWSRSERGTRRSSGSSTRTGGIARWYAGRWSQEQALRFAEEMERSWRDRGVGKWLAYADPAGAPIGRGGPSLAVVEGEERVEIGWALRRAAWGRGYATEIGRAGLDHAFSVLGVEEVVSFTEVHNARSRAVMERLGMRYIRRIRRPGLIAGSAAVHEAAPFALYRISRPAHDPP